MSNLSIEAKNELVKLQGVKFIKSFEGIDEYKLDNGLKILLKPNQNFPLVSWQVWYKVGSRNEQPRLTGIAHYLEHIMFKGTKTFDKGEIAQAIQLKGGIFNAFTGDDYTAYFENFSPENLELAIKIEADRMRNAKIDKEEVELERTVIISELEGGKNSPQNVLYETLRANAFTSHNYRHPVIGWREDLDNINSLRIKEFYDLYYSPDNAVIVLAGNFESENALDLIKKYFGAYKASSHKRPQVAQEPEEMKGDKQIKIFNDGALKMLAIAFNIPGFDHEDYPALNIIGDIVFNGLSSRLYKKLVDSGLAVSVSGHAESNIDPGIFRIFVNLTPDTSFAQASEVIYKELEDLKKNLVSDEELKIAKAKEEASAIYQRDGVYEDGLQLGYYEAISKDWTRYSKWVDEINDVDAKDIKEVAKKYFTSEHRTVVELHPQESDGALVAVEQDIEPATEAFYGAAITPPLDPKKLKRLVKLTEPKFTKNQKASDLHLDFKKLELSLANGQDLSIYYRKDTSLPLIFMNANFFAGSANEGEDFGKAHLTAKMLDRGSKDKSKFEISKLLDLYGAGIDFSSNTESSKLEFSTLSKNLDESTKILKEILYKPLFSAEELEKLKLQTITKLKLEDDSPGKISRREFKQIIYPEGHPYHIPSVEKRIKAVESLSIEKIKDFYAKFYNSDGLVISVVGDIEEDKLLDLLKDIFDGWNLDKTTADHSITELKPDIPVVKVKDKEERINIDEAKSQSEITMGHSLEVNRKHPDFYPLYIANFILGGSPLSSRLGNEVRDKNGFVYNIRSNFNAALGADAYQIVLGCNPKNVRNAIKLTTEIVEDFAKNGANETELEVAKSFMIGSFAARALSSNDDISETLSQIMLYDLGDNYINNYRKTIEGISLKQVNAAAKKYLHPDKFSVSIAGPKFE